MLSLNKRSETIQSYINKRVSELNETEDFSEELFYDCLEGEDAPIYNKELNTIQEIEEAVEELIQLNLEVNAELEEEGEDLVISNSVKEETVNQQLLETIEEIEKESYKNNISNLNNLYHNSKVEDAPVLTTNTNTNNTQQEENNMTVNNNNNAEIRLNSLQVAILFVVAVLMVSKALYVFTVNAANFTYKLGRMAGHYYYNSEFYNPIVSEVREALETEAEVIKECAGNYACGACLFVSILHANYLQLLTFVSDIKVAGRTEYNGLVVSSVV